MITDSATTVSIIYFSPRGSEIIIRNRAKLQRRLLRAIEDMVEDGFTTFLLPIEEYSPFPTTAIDAFIDAKIQHPNIRLTIMLHYDVEGVFAIPSAERNHHYCKYADAIIYNNEESPSNSAEKLLSLSSAVITYFEHTCARFYYTTNHAISHRIPFVNINI